MEAEGSLTLAFASHPGRRPRQEDATYVARISDGAVIAVADGMGGHSAGEEASRLAIDAIHESANELPTGESVQAFLDQVANRANAAILKHGDEIPESVGLGTTFVAAVIREGRIVIGHAGDSRAFLVTSDEVALLTRDHSAVQDALDRGLISEEEADDALYKNAVVRFLGMKDFPGADCNPGKGHLDLPEDSVVLLMSDGAYRHLSEADILEHLSGTPNLSQGLQHLMRLAYHYGSDDNISLVACEFGELTRTRISSQEPLPIPEQRIEEFPVSSRKRMLSVLVGVCTVVLVALVTALVGSVWKDADQSTKLNHVPDTPTLAQEIEEEQPEQSTGLTDDVNPQEEPVDSQDPKPHVDGPEAQNDQ